MDEAPWIRQYPQGIPAMPKLSGTSASDMLAESARRWPDRPALTYEGQTLDYRTLDALVSRVAAGLQQFGVGPGIHVGLFVPNSPLYVLSFFGVLRAGGTVVNYSPLDALRTLEHKIADSQTDLMIAADSEAFHAPMVGLLETTRLHTLIIGSPGTPGDRADLPVEGPGIRAFSELLNTPDTLLAAAPVTDLSAIAVLQYTGGTTGLPKGAMLSQGNLSAATDQLQTALRTTLEPGSERIMAVLPPFHIYAIMVNMMLGIRLGAQLYLHGQFDPERVLADIERHRITVFPAVPTMLSALLAHPRLADYDLRSLKLCNSGGAPLPVELQQQFQRAAGCSVKEGWGMTETTTVGTFTPAGMISPPGACGVPVPGVRLKIIALDGSNAEQAYGEPGELCIAGPNVLQGYWNRPDATEESMTPDGYFRTGDIAWISDEGFVYIIDRAKDMIICSGYNVYPRNIEEAIYEHPDVEEVLVIGIADSYRGQTPKAFVKLRSGAEPLSLADLKEFLKPRLGKHEMVHALELRDALPRTPVGKLSKKELYAGEQTTP